MSPTKRKAAELDPRILAAAELMNAWPEAAWRPIVDLVHRIDRVQPVTRTPHTRPPRIELGRTPADREPVRDLSPRRAAKELPL